MLLQPHAGKIAAIAFSPPAGKLVATAHYDHTARIWDARTGRQLMFLMGHKSEVHYVGFSPDGSCVVTAGEDGPPEYGTFFGAGELALNGHYRAGLLRGYSPTESGSRGRPR